MISLFLGFASIIGIFAFALEENASFYLQKHSIGIVLGGTIAVLLLSNTTDTIKNLFKSLFNLGKRDREITDFQDDLISLTNDRSLPRRNNSHPLLMYAADLWEQGVDPNLFIVLVSQKRNELISAESEVVQALKNLAKYPPALGMAGTVIGMVELFMNLDGNSGSVGGSLAFAMTATFFGIALTNVLISPLADRLHVKTVMDKRRVTALYEILLLINGNNPSTLIIDEVKSRAA